MASCLNPYTSDDEAELTLDSKLADFCDAASAAVDAAARCAFSCCWIAAAAAFSLSSDATCVAADDLKHSLGIGCK